MTACAIESAAGEGRTVRHTSFRIAADRSYAARLNSAGDDGWYTERWTLDGPEPYAVPLPGAHPERPESRVLPLSDGRVLIARHETEQHHFALLYPTGPRTGELPLGSVASGRLTLLPPAPCGRRAYALVHGAGTTGVWLVTDTRSGAPELLAEIPGHCSGGAWLDGEGRLLALDRTEEPPAAEDPDADGQGRGDFASGHPATRTVRAIRAIRAARATRRTPVTTKTVVVDLRRGGEVTPLLQITDDSNDRLLAADRDSGLLLIRSDAPGEDRIGWGVLGSQRPVRFPEALRPDGVRLTPLAVQPGQPLLPESCAVALQVEGPNGVWIAVWSPAEKELRHVGAPEGWLRGSALWTREGELQLPVSTPHQSCGLARLRSAEQPRQAPLPRPGLSAPVAQETAAQQKPPPGRDGHTEQPEAAADAESAAAEEVPQPEGAGPETDPADRDEEAPSGRPEYLDDALPGEDGAPACRPVPLQQAPLATRAG